CSYRRLRRCSCCQVLPEIYTVLDVPRHARPPPTERPFHCDAALRSRVPLDGLDELVFPGRKIVSTDEKNTARLLARVSDDRGRHGRIDAVIVLIIGDPQSLIAVEYFP